VHSSWRAADSDGVGEYIDALTEKVSSVAMGPGHEGFSTEIPLTRAAACNVNMQHHQLLQHIFCH
jgi:hypothetical protein